MGYDHQNSAVDGFINFYKPSGMTSMEAVRRIKKLTGVSKKIGHAGTLDPLAKGLLPICVGKGTRLMENVLEGSKEYKVQIQLGAITETYDAEGEIRITGSADGLCISDIEQCISTFIGKSEQIPPMYSAVKVNGKRLYKLARKGIEINRTPRPITIYEIQVLNFDKPLLTLIVQCGKGVYIRSLAHDLGQRLGCGGFVTELERLRCGSFKKSEAVTLLELETKTCHDGDGWRGCLEPIDFVLQGLRSVVVSDSNKPQLLNGMSVDIDFDPQEIRMLESFRAYDTLGRFLALVQCDHLTGLWKPFKVFNENNISCYAPN